MTRRNLATLQACLGIAALSAMDAIIKELAGRYPTFQLAFLRYLFGAAAIVALAVAWRTPFPSRESLRVNGLRALLVAATAVTFFYGLGVLPLAEVLALSFLSPLFIALFGVLFLRERLNRGIGAGLALGLVGMGIVVAGQVSPARSALGGPQILGIAAVFTSALTYALSMVLLRARAARDPVIAIVAIQNVGPGLLLALPATAVWRLPDGPDWPLLAGVGLLGIAGHLLLGKAYAAVEAAPLAVLEYTALFWAVVFGYWVFGEVPSATTMAGTALIVAASVLAARH